MVLAHIIDIHIDFSVFLAVGKPSHVIFVMTNLKNMIKL